MMSKSLYLALLCMIAWSVSGSSCYKYTFGLSRGIYYAEGEGYAVLTTDNHINTFRDHSTSYSHTFVFPTYQDALNFVEMYLDRQTSSDRVGDLKDYQSNDAKSNYKYLYPSVDLKVVDGFDSRKWRRVDGPVNPEPPVAERKEPPATEPKTEPSPHIVTVVPELTMVPVETKPAPQTLTPVPGQVDPMLERSLLGRQPVATVPLH